LILCALMNLTISAPSIKLSISMLFRILHTLSISTGPNIFLNICLLKMRRLFASFAVSVPVCDQYVTTGLIIVLYIFILMFSFKSFDFNLILTIMEFQTQINFTFKEKFFPVHEMRSYAGGWR
jgi:hypothetical protein